MNLSFLLQDTGSIYGAEQATLDLARALRDRMAYQPHFLLIEETRLKLAASPLRNEIARHQFSYDALPVDSRFSRRLIQDIRMRLVERKTDILHTIGYKADVHGGAAAGWGQTTPVVSTVHGWLFRPDLKEQFYGWLNLRALRRFTRVVTLSRYYENFLLGKGVSRERLVRIPSGLTDVPEGRPAVRRTSVWTIGMMARLSWEKNHSMFLRAIRQSIDAGVSLRAVIAGDGPERDHLQRLCRELRLESHVEWPGYMARDEFFQQIDALVLCSRMENLPYSVMEAMARALPIVATHVGGLPDLVEEGVTGFLVPPDNSKQLADRLVELNKDAALGRRMGEAAREKQQREFKIPRCADQHHDLYASLCRRSGS